MTLQRDLGRVLDEAREEGRRAGRSEGAQRLSENEAGASLLGIFAETCEAMSRKGAGTARKAFEEAAAILKEGEKEVRSEMRALKKSPSKKKSDD